MRFFAIPALILLASLSAEAKPSTRVLLIGVDAADWNVIQSMSAQGKLPNLQHLMQTGVSGQLASLPVRPVNMSNSAAIWTSIATGKKRERHGIYNFTRESEPSGPLRLNTQLDRKCKAFWNILSGAQRTVSVLGWWLTWPAEPVNGLMISYDFWPARRSLNGSCSGCAESSGLADRTPPAHSTYPERAAKRYARWLVFERDLADAAAMEVHEGPDYHNDDYWAYARDTSFFRIAQDVLKSRSQDILAVYFESIDIVSHRWWWAKIGEDDSLTPMSEEDRVRVGERIARYYSYMDSMIGQLIQAAGPDATTIVVSDHGFETYQDLRALEHKLGKYVSQFTAEERRQYGVDATSSSGHSDKSVFFMAGKGVRHGERLTGGSIYDVAPTLLYLTGLPPAKDMDGDVLRPAFEDSYLKDHPVQYVASYETGGSASSSASGQNPDQAELIKRLKSLGYLK